MNKQSNGYIIFYTVVLTVVCAFLLAMASEGLKSFKQANIDFDLKRNILGTTMRDDLVGKTQKEIEDLYDQLVKDVFVVDNKGNKVEGFDIKKVSIDFVKEEYRKPAAERILPVYRVADLQNPEAATYYVLPMYGFGLWDYIWGFVALESDLTTVKGTIFAHKGETPGLGARIANIEIQKRYEKKKIAEGDVIKPVIMQKGEGNDYSGDDYAVDGMSGATITGRGLNNMLDDYLNAYKGFIEKEKSTLSLAD